MSVTNSTAVKPGRYWRRPKQTPKEIRGNPKQRNWAQLTEDRIASNYVAQTTKTQVEDKEEEEDDEEKETKKEEKEERKKRRSLL